MFNQRIARALDRPVQPSARRHPRTSVVLPAPSSPDSVTTIPPRSAGRAARRPLRSRRHREDRGWRSTSVVLRVGRATGCRVRLQVMYAARMTLIRLHPQPVAAIATGTRSPPTFGRWGEALGFQEIGIADTDLDAEEQRLLDWLAAGRHGAMDYMARHGATRARPATLVPGTLRVITARMNYRPPAARAERRGPRRSDQGVHRALRARPRLPQGAARASSSGSRCASASRSATSATACSPTARRCSKWRWRAKSGHRLAGQAHAAPDARSGLVVLPGRDLHRPAAAGDAAADRRTAAAAARASTSARPARSSRRTSSTRAAASRI